VRRLLAIVALSLVTCAVLGSGYRTGTQSGGVRVSFDPTAEIRLSSTISTANSTTATLDADGVYTGTAEELTDYAGAIVTIYSDQASATDGLEIQWSPDGTNWDGADAFTVPAATQKTFSFQPVAKYLRVQYTNGGTTQAVFRLQTQLKATNFKASSHRIQDPISTDDDAELVKAVITGADEDGTFQNFSATPNGNFKVAVNEYGDTPSIDPFDRLRVSNPFTLFDSKQLYDKQPLFWDEALGGSATSAHNKTNACTEMAVTASAGDYVIRQTKQRFNYQPGKGQLILMTFQGEQTEGLTKRVGAFRVAATNDLTPVDGIYLELDGDVSWNIAKTSNTAETVTQANWNVDPLDGTGPSGVDLDFSAAQIAIIDYEWLGVGRVRVGFVVDGIIRYCHYFNHANQGFASVYMSTPNLPLCYTLTTDGTAAGTLDHICSSVMSEGGVEETGVLRSASTGTTHVDANTADTTYAIVGIRLKSTHLDLTVLPQFVDVLSETDTAFRWSLRLNPTVAGTFAYGDITNSGIQYATGATANTVTGGIEIDGGFASATFRGGGSGGRKLETSLRMGSTIGGTVDTLVLCATPLSASADIQGSITWRELL